MQEHPKKSFMFFFTLEKRVASHPSVPKTLSCFVNMRITCEKSLGSVPPIIIIGTLYCALLRFCGRTLIIDKITAPEKKGKKITSDLYKYEHEHEHAWVRRKVGNSEETYQGTVIVKKRRRIYLSPMIRNSIANEVSVI